MAELYDGNIAEFLEAHREDLIGLRHHLHQQPELSWHEFETTALLVQRLERAGLAPRMLPRGTGLICDVGKTPGPRIALRADIDALPVADLKDVTHKSQRENVSHACGHDVHTACVLGAGLALAAIFEQEERPFGDVGVRLLFQPAEEDVPSGAPTMIAAGALEEVAQIFALHCDPNIDLGSIGIHLGPMSAATDAVQITLEGPGGHTARPHLTADLVGLAAKVVTETTSGMSRLTDIRGGANLTYGSIHGGSAANVIPNEVRLLGSMRALDRDTWDAVPELLNGLIESVVRPYGADFELDYRRGSPPVVNEAKATRVVEDVGARLLGDDNVIDIAQSLGGEDFSWYLETVPGAYFRLGVHTERRKRSGLDLHNGALEIVDESIDIGARVLASVAAQAASDVAVSRGF